jgi:hypothetical protein
LQEENPYRYMELTGKTPGFVKFLETLTLEMGDRTQTNISGIRLVV